MATGARYVIEFAPSAGKQLAAIPTRFREQISRKIEKLRDNPFPQGVTPIKGEPGAYRITSGNYRILLRSPSRQTHHPRLQGWRPQGCV